MVNLNLDKLGYYIRIVHCFESNVKFRIFRNIVVRVVTLLSFKMNCKFILHCGG